MTVIEKTKQIISQFDGLSEFTDTVDIDFVEDNIDSYGLSPIGDELISEDILGNQKRRHSFVLYARHQSAENAERLQNSEFLLKLGYYLEKQKEIVFEGGKIIAISSANGMAYSHPEDNPMDITYQLQIYTNYEKEAI